MTREEAKRVLEFDLDHKHNNESKEALRMAIKALEQEPKTGHWIEQIDHEENCRTLICSNCDRPALHDEDSIWKHKFCPHCGAKMIELQESEDKE